MAEYGLKIEAKSYDHLFQRMKTGAWLSPDAKLAWPCLTFSPIADAGNDAVTIARSWLKSQIESWDKEAHSSTKRSALKEADGAIIPLIAHSGSPLKEFDEASFRINDNDFTRDAKWPGEDAPPHRLTLASFPVAVFELNKCAVTDPNEIVKECDKITGVRKSYAEASGSFKSTYESLPKSAIEHRMAKLKKGNDSRASTKTNMDAFNAQVGKVGNLDDFRNIIVTLVTAAKCGKDMPTLPFQAHAISEDIGKFQWGSLEVGTNHFLRAPLFISFIGDSVSIFCYSPDVLTIRNRFDALHARAGCGKIRDASVLSPTFRGLF